MCFDQFFDICLPFIVSSWEGRFLCEYNYVVSLLELQARSISTFEQQCRKKA